jgi:hypothetical protein
MNFLQVVVELEGHYYSWSYFKAGIIYWEFHGRKFLRLFG